MDDERMNAAGGHRADDAHDRDDDHELEERNSGAQMLTTAHTAGWVCEGGGFGGNRRRFVTCDARCMTG